MHSFFHTVLPPATRLLYHNHQQNKMNTTNLPLNEKASCKRKLSNADGSSPKKKIDVKLASGARTLSPKTPLLKSHCDAKNTKSRHSGPLLIPSPSCPIISDVAQYVDLPIRSDLAKAKSSETLFVDSNSKRRHSASQPNATFAFVQRSGKEFIVASIKRLSQIVTDNAVSSDLAGSKESLHCATTVYKDFIGLYGYAQDEYYRIILSRANAIQVTIDALTAFPNNDLIQASGILLIGSMCTKSLSNALKLVESGGLRNIIDGLKNHGDNSHVCSMTINCLLRVMESSELAIMFLKNMHDSTTVIQSISNDALTYESPRNREIVLNMLDSTEKCDKSDPKASAESTSVSTP